MVDRVITKARRLGKVAYTPADQLSLADSGRRLAAQKQVGKFLQRFAVVTTAGGDEQKIDLIEKVFVDLAERYKDRAGGYTRIVKVGNRKGDNAPVSVIELVGEEAKNASPKQPKSTDKSQSAQSQAESSSSEPAAGEASEEAKEEAEA